MNRRFATAAITFTSALVIAGCSSGTSSSTVDSAGVSVTGSAGENTAAVETTEAVETTTDATAETSESEAAETETATDPGDATPATGPVISGTGYTFNAPDGWEAVEVAEGLDAQVANRADADGFADNINVLLSPAGELSSDVIEQAARTELESSGATDIVVNDRVTVAGQESVHLSSTFNYSDMTYGIEQYYVPNNGQAYVVTFSFSTSVPAEDRVALADSVLATWQWV